MMEGDIYPELRWAKIEPYTLERAVPNYSLIWDRNSADPISMQRISVPAVRVTMPAEDWERMQEIYRAHYHAEHRNPGVRDAWERYRIMVALSR